MEQNKCRQCGKEVKNNIKYSFYGGAVCSANCEIDAAYELEASMPNNRMPSGDRLSAISRFAKESVIANWFNTTKQPPNNE
jgi:hypothetical protein